MTSMDKFRAAAIGLLLFCILVVIVTAWYVKTHHIGLVSKEKTTMLYEDTIYLKKVNVPYDAIFDKDGTVEKVWYKNIKTDSGYIIKLDNGNYIVNGKEMFPDYFKL